MPSLDPLEYGWLCDIMPLLSEYPEYRATLGNDFDVYVYAKIGIDIDGYVLRRGGQIILCGYIDEIQIGDHAKIHILFKRHALSLKESMPILHDRMRVLMERYQLGRLIANVPSDNKPCIVLSKLLGFKYICDKEGFTVFEYLA
jgi:hypothetical protein